MQLTIRVVLVRNDPRISDIRYAMSGKLPYYIFFDMIIHSVPINGLFPIHAVAVAMKKFRPKRIDQL